LAQVRVGLVGCGNIGFNLHLPALRAVEGIDLVALADPTAARLTLAREAAELPPDACVADWRDLVSRSDVDAVVVATPQRARPEIAIAAAEAGKHLLCEKPLAIAPADAWRMVEAARRNNVTMATVHNYTFIPVYRMLKDVLDGGEIGALETAELNFLSVEDRPGSADYRPRWRHDVAESGGGVLMDMLHAVYLAGWFFGADPIAVSAVVDRRFDDGSNVEDYALVRYDYPTGHALINMAWGHGIGGTNLMGTSGRAVLVTRGFGTHPFVPPERIHLTTADGARELAPDPGFGPSFELIAADFRDAVAHGRPPAAPGAAGAAVLGAVVGAYESAALGREVRLPLDEGDPVYQFGAAGIARLAVSAHSQVWRRRLYGVGNAS
jgi:predicted dehydrogenase